MAGVPQRFTHQELEAWARLHRCALHPIEVDAVMFLDGEYFGWWLEQKKRPQGEDED